MKIHLVSDLHTEFRTPKSGAEILDRIPNENVDVLVVAGDLSTGFKQHIKKNLRQLCDKFENVVYVLGNHDHWRSEIDRRHEQLNNLASRIPNLHFLEKSVAEIDGQRFIGGTLWYPEEPMAPPASHWVDHLYVEPDKAAGTTYQMITREHEKTVEFFKSEMKEGDIVVTHHLPSYGVISDQWVGSLYNCYFASNMDRLIADKKPAFWLYGHSHDFKHMMLDQTETLRNPYGYPHEGSEYDKEFIIDIELDE